MKTKPKPHLERCSECKELKEVRRLIEVTAEPGGKTYFLCARCYFKKGVKL